MLNRKSCWYIGYHLAQDTLGNPDITMRVTESWQVQEMLRGYRASKPEPRDPALEALGYYELPSDSVRMLTVRHDNRMQYDIREA